MTSGGCFDDSAAEVFARLDAEAPGVALAAFGQTVFWDEPMKRVVLEARDAAGSQREALVGVHDLDYFSRMPEGDGGEYGVVARNDVATRELWSAAGELSALFGCEVWPSRDRLNELGLRLNVALGPGLEGLGKVTEAWGWRGLVRSAGDAPVVRDVPVEEVADGLCDLLKWGVGESAACLAEAEAQAAARKLERRLVQLVRETAAQEGVRTLSDLFMRLAPHLWGLVSSRCEASDNPPAMTVTRTSDVFCLNRETARRARFRLLNLFLDPRTKDAARRAYDGAVEGAPMYALEEFGTGAIPFDLYVPGRGRGTLFLLEGHVVAHTTPRTVIEVKRPVCTASCLAKAIEQQVGANVAVAGKAVVLAAMIASEFVFVLNERGSAYVSRTAQLVRGLRAEGIDFRVHPILRVRYHTWESLHGVAARFRLPDHLAQAFGKRHVTADEFARGWRQAVRDQEALLRRLKELRGPADILSFLGLEKQEEWYGRLREYQAAQETLLRIQHGVSDLKRRAQAIREGEDAALEALQGLERQRGRLNRENLKPLRRRLEGSDCRVEGGKIAGQLAHIEREHREAVAEMESKLAERKRLAAERKELTQAYRRLERGEEAGQARKVLRRVERAAERERLELARNAILASEGLPQTEVRPAAWWLPLVDPKGNWYAGVRRTAQFRLERLDADV